MKAKTTIVLDTRRSLKNGKYPIKLRVTYNRSQKYYPTNFSCSKDEFEKYMGRNPKGADKTMRLAIDAIEQKANSIANEMSIFDFGVFTKKLLKNEQLREDVYSYYDKVIKEYKQNGQIGTASSYSCSKNSIKEFKPKLAFWEINPDFLRNYEKHLLKAGKSISTVGIYLRPLKAIINRAIADETLPKDFNYPFGSKSALKYQIPTGKNTKKSLNTLELKSIFEYKAGNDTWEDKALDYWKFSYLANGMNMKDISLLKYGDIKGDFIEFVRAKTASTNRNQIAIKVFLSEELKSIISKRGNERHNENTLIFPIIKQSTSLEKQRTDLQQFTKMINRYMRRVSESLGIKKDCTTYTARHSTATILKRAGADIQMISEALGHSSISTTKSYLDSFEDDSKKEMSKLLTAFK